MQIRLLQDLHAINLSRKEKMRSGTHLKRLVELPSLS